MLSLLSLLSNNCPLRLGGLCLGSLKLWCYYSHAGSGLDLIG